MAWTAGPVAGVVAAPGLPDSLGLAAPGTGTMVAGTGATGMGDPRTQKTGTWAPGARTGALRTAEISAATSSGGAAGPESGTDAGGS